MINEILAKRGIPAVWDGKGDWETRRKEIINLLLDEEYGRMPAHESVSFSIANDISFCAGKARLKTVRVTARFGGGEFTFPVYAMLPTKPGKHPFFVLLNFSEAVPDKCYPCEEICDRGYAVLSIHYNDVTIDAGFSEGGREKQGLAQLVHPISPNCGKISMWAWAASRALDYAFTLDCLDHSRATVIGHSRLGKTALLASALDERFFCAVANESGCSGASLTRGRIGESVRFINETFPFWFSEEYRKYIDRENDLPFDQHFLVAASAPRCVIVSSAAEDSWADPDSEYLSCCAASEVWEKLGKTGFVHPDRLPAVGDVFHEGEIGYHLRGGSHYLSREDWNRHMDFLDKKHSRA